MTMQTTTEGTCHELELNDIEFLDAPRATGWRDLLATIDDEEDERVETMPPTTARWDEAIERADTRIWIRPYAARS